MKYRKYKACRLAHKMQRRRRLHYFAATRLQAAIGNYYVAIGPYALERIELFRNETAETLTRTTPLDLALVLQIKLMIGRLDDLMKPNKLDALSVEIERAKRR